MGETLRRIHPAFRLSRAPRGTPLGILSSAGILGPSCSLIHCNYPGPRDAETIAESGASVVYCPRSHGFFRYAPYRLEEFLAAGVNVALGSDSLASNEDLGILEEMREVARRHPAVGAYEIVAMGTLNGTRALGLGDRAGSLDRGKLADVCVVGLASERRGWEQILSDGRCRPIMTIAGGEMIHGRGEGC